MTEEARRYWLLALLALLTVGFTWLCAWLTDQLATRIKHRRRPPAPQKTVGAHCVRPSLLS